MKTVVNLIPCLDKARETDDGRRE